MATAHPFQQIAAENALLWRTMSVKPMWVNHVDKTAKGLLALRARYAVPSSLTGVPVAVIMCIAQREMSGSMSRQLAQGDPLTDYGIHVPKGSPKVGHGPPFTWEEAAAWALKYDGLDKVKDWSIVRALYEFEAFNGFGSRNHGIRSPYVWALTQHQQPGKYVADGVWDPNHVDTQMGTAPLLRRLGELAADLALPLGYDGVAPVPVGVGGGDRDTTWLQNALNTLGADPKLGVDSNYGRRTRTAVRDYQTANGLEADGLFGPKTLASIEAKLKAGGKEIASAPAQ